LKKSGASDFKIKLNSLGCSEDKKKINALFKNELRLKVKHLCQDCQTRIEKNVFRVLDCKNPDCKKIIQGLPAIIDNICEGCKSHFDRVKEGLDLLAVKYEVDSYLVRGLDYYTKTAFEVTPTKSGSLRGAIATKQSQSQEIASLRFAELAMTEKAQDAIAAGGRYDNLVKDLGGPSMPAVGFAIGIERLLMAMDNPDAQTPRRPEKVYIATLGEAARKKAFELASELRSEGIACQMEYEDKSLKAQLRAAAASSCAYAAILGEDELKKNKITLRDMAKSEQQEIEINKIVTYIKERI
jgi:histidyl-tRNA synthetase